jgi:hypothetical protein
MRLEPRGSGSAHVSVAWPGELRQSLTVFPGGLLIDRSITVPSGGLTIELDSPASDSVATNYGRKTLRVVDPWVIDEELLEIVRLSPS